MTGRRKHCPATAHGARRSSSPRAAASRTARQLRQIAIDCPEDRDPYALPAPARRACRRSRSSSAPVGTHTSADSHDAASDLPCAPTSQSTRPEQNPQLPRRLTLPCPVPHPTHAGPRSHDHRELQPRCLRAATPAASPLLPSCSMPPPPGARQTPPGPPPPSSRSHSSSTHSRPETPRTAPPAPAAPLPSAPLLPAPLPAARTPTPRHDPLPSSPPPRARWYR